MGAHAGTSLLNKHQVTSNMQLLECDGDLYLFSERQDQGDVRVHHCIEKLQSVVRGTAVSREWKNVMKRGTSRSWGITGDVFEYTCVPHGEGKICIFNNIEHKGVVYDIVQGVEVDLLPPPPKNGEAQQFSSLNPISFSFAPRSCTGSVGEDLGHGAARVGNDKLIHFSEDITSSNLTELIPDMVRSVLLLASGTYEEHARMKGVSKAVKNVLESEEYYDSCGKARETEGSFTLLMFAVKEERLHCVAFDLTAEKWRRLPPLKWISSPTNAVLSDYLVAGGRGLLCVTVADSHNPGTFVVYNPLKNRQRRLPPSTFRLDPVLMHFLVSPETHSYKLIVAGSSLQDNPDTSRFTEVFDSETGVWTVTGDVPRGAGDIALVEHQTGVYAAGFLYCIAHWRSVPGVKVILAYDVERGEWSNRHPPLPYDLQEPGPFGPRYHIAQLVVCDGEVYLFSEIGHFWDKRSCLDKLNRDAFNAQGDNNRRQCWSNMWAKVRSRDNDTGKLVCVPHVPGKVCIFNKDRFTGVVYDINEDPAPQIPAATEPFIPGETSFCVHSLRCIFEPSFKPNP